MKRILLVFGLSISLFVKCQKYIDVNWGDEKYLQPLVGGNPLGEVSIHNYIFRDSLPNGNYRLVKNDTVLVETTFKNNKKNGITRHWYSNGKLKKVEQWKNGLKNGEHLSFYENGMLSDFIYYEDNVIDRCRYWFEEQGRKFKERCINDSTWIQKEWKKDYYVIKIGDIKNKNWVNGVKKKYYYSTLDVLQKEEDWYNGVLKKTKDYDKNDGLIKKD